VPEEPVRTGPRHARPARSREPFDYSIVLGGGALGGPAHHRSAVYRPAHHRGAHHRDAPAPALPNRPPLWRRSPAVPAAVAVLAVWSSANLPQVLTAGQAGPSARAASSQANPAALAAGSLGGGGGVAAGSASDSASDAAIDHAAVIAAARLAAVHRVSRGERALPGDGAASKAPAPRPAALKPATAIPAAPATKPAAIPPAPAAKPTAKPAVPAARAAVGRWVRPSAGGQSSCFCMRWGRMHNGIDLAGPNGSPILAVGDGVVVEAGPAAGYGMWVAIRHANGDHSIYGHMYQTYVSVGEHVRAGHHIADIGANGHSTGPHLHFEITRGSLTGPHLDPAVWLRERGVEVGPYNPDA
jgi:murein DD-endopeptidase MepM/ murein hydrolase activator NlpD